MSQNNLDSNRVTTEAPDTDSPSITLSLPKSAVRELIKDILEETLSVLSWPAGRVALNEVEAAEACGLKRTTLRDLRLAGRVKASRVGVKWVYTRDDLLRALKTHENLESSKTASYPMDNHADSPHGTLRSRKSRGPFPRIRSRSLTTDLEGDKEPHTRL